MERCREGSRHARDLSPITGRDELLSGRYRSPVQAGLQFSVPFSSVFALRNSAQALCNPTAAYGIVQGVNQGSLWPSLTESKTSICLFGLAVQLTTHSSGSLRPRRCRESDEQPTPYLAPAPPQIDLVADLLLKAARLE